MPEPLETLVADRMLGTTGICHQQQHEHQNIKNSRKLTTETMKTAGTHGTSTAESTATVEATGT
jgi:hypothetical protein